MDDLHKFRGVAEEASFFFTLVGSTYAQDIYKFTRMAISTEVSMTKYEVPRGNIIM